MKNPLRSVIVEYKGRRSRKMRKPNAIWGDLDLKAVARQVEEDILPVEISIPKTRSSQTILPAVKEVPPAESVPNIEVPTIVTPKTLDTPSVPEPSFTEQLDGETEPLKSTPKRKARRAHEQPPIVPASHEISITNDELNALEAENAELKRQLMLRLQRENAQLAQMLARIKRSS